MQNQSVSQSPWANFSYSTIKNEMQGGDARAGLPPGMHMLAAAQSGVLTLAMTNPIWVVKTMAAAMVFKAKPTILGAATNCPSSAPS